jgi:hypothetical protein
LFPHTSLNVTVPDYFVTQEEIMWDNILVSCGRWEDIVGAINEVIRQLPREMKRPFGAIFSRYMASYGMEGAYERLNNRSVSQILMEYKECTPKEVLSGECNGVKYRLYEAPESAADDDRHDDR